MNLANRAKLMKLTKAQLVEAIEDLLAEYTIISDSHYDPEIVQEYNDLINGILNKARK